MKVKLAIEMSREDGRAIIELRNEDDQVTREEALERAWEKLRLALQKELERLDLFGELQRED